MKKLLLIGILLLTGCAQTNTPQESKATGVIKLQTVKVIDPATMMYGEGSAFAVSPNVVVTALHNLSDPYTILKLNGKPVIVLKSVPFGRDGLAIVVNRIPKGTKIYAMKECPALGTHIKAAGYIPSKGFAELKGTLTATGTIAGLVSKGQSGGAILHQGKAIGTISALIPTYGISLFDPLDIPMLNKLIEENNYE